MFAAGSLGAVGFSSQIHIRAAAKLILDLCFWIPLVFDDHGVQGDSSEVSQNDRCSPCGRVFCPMQFHGMAVRSHIYSLVFFRTLFLSISVNVSRRMNVSKHCPF